MFYPTAAHAKNPDNGIMRAMFIARKEVFIDLLKWNLPVLADQFELDHFDAETVKYLILIDPDQRHRASARLLPADRPHILIDLFSHLYTKPIPQGPKVREIPRFGLDRHQTALERRRVRNHLVTALVEYALGNDITDYTGVAEEGWFSQITDFGWDCEVLGPPARHQGRMLRALHIRINDRTIEDLRSKGIYEEAGLRLKTLQGVSL